MDLNEPRARISPRPELTTWHHDDPEWRPQSFPYSNDFNHAYPGRFFD